jgi:hypothetical protein
VSFPLKVASRATRMWGPKPQSVICAHRCHLHRCACHSGVIYTDVHVKAVSMTPLCVSQRCQSHHCAVCSRIIFPHKTVVFRILRENFRQSWSHSGVNDTTVHVTAMSMTPLCNQLCRFTPQIRSHIQKGLTPVSGP